MALSALCLNHRKPYRKQE